MQNGESAPASPAPVDIAEASHTLPTEPEEHQETYADLSFVREYELRQISNLLIWILGRVGGYEDLRKDVYKKVSLVEKFVPAVHDFINR